MAESANAARVEESLAWVRECEGFRRAGLDRIFWPLVVKLGWDGLSPTQEGQDASTYVSSDLIASTADLMGKMV